MSPYIEKISLSGFKSFREVKDLELRRLNILIGANGSGKSNFVSFFTMLQAMAAGQLQNHVARRGSPEAFLHHGSKNTDHITGEFRFGAQPGVARVSSAPEDHIAGLRFKLSHSTDERLIYSHFEFTNSLEGRQTSLIPVVSAKIQGNRGEIRIPDNAAMNLGSVTMPVKEILQGIVIYHFHDTGDTAHVKKLRPINDNEKLQGDASNLAAYLYRLRNQTPEVYENIRETIRLIVPFFDDFKLRPDPNSTDLIRLEWTQRGSDYPFLAHQLSDGTLRFMCLAVALLQPSPPVTMLFDEPELGLHPYAITVLASVMKAASQHTQVIACTQSVTFLDCFEPGDVIIADRTNGATTLRRLESDKLREWLEDYSLGEIWMKNLIDGRPHS